MMHAALLRNSGTQHIQSVYNDSTIEIAGFLKHDSHVTAYLFPGESQLLAGVCVLRMENMLTNESIIIMKQLSFHGARTESALEREQDLGRNDRLTEAHSDPLFRSLIQHTNTCTAHSL